MKAKILSFFTILSLVATFAYSQKPIPAYKVSREARHTIHTKYPTVKEFNWQINDDDNYIVSFIDKNGEKEVINITQSGDFINNIEYNKLPIEVRKIISMEVNPSDIKQIIIGKNKEYSKVYLIETKTKKIFISSDGKILFKFCN